MVNGKFVPVYTIRHTGEAQLQLQRSVTSAENRELSDQPQASAASTLRKDPQHPLNRRPDGPKGWSNALDRKNVSCFC